MYQVAFTLALALAGQAQPNEAEKLFGEMAIKLAGANTLQVTVEASLSGIKAGKFKGTITQAAGNKGHVAMTGELDGKPFGFTTVSDGARQRTTEPGQAKPFERDTPKDYNDVLIAVLERSGMAIGLFLIIPKEDGKIRDQLPVEGFKFGKVEPIAGRAAQAVEYVLKLSKDRPLNVTVWIDTKTQLPLRRQVTATFGKQNISVTEDYTNFRLGEAVDLKLFELAK